MIKKNSKKIIETPRLVEKFQEKTAYRNITCINVRFGKYSRKKIKGKNDARKHVKKFNVCLLKKMRIGNGSPEDIPPRNITYINNYLLVF